MDITTNIICVKPSNSKVQETFNVEISIQVHKITVLILKVSEEKCIKNEKKDIIQIMPIVTIPRFFQASVVPENIDASPKTRETQAGAKIINK